MLKLNLKCYLLFCALSFLLNANAQEQLGIRSDNYLGINGNTLNPANSATTPFNWDVNLLELDFFIKTNYVFFENSSLLSLLNNDQDYIYGPNNRRRDVPREGLILDYYDDNTERYGFSNYNIMGPSFFVRLSPRSSIGLITRGRAVASVTGIPPELSYYQFNSTIGQAGFTMQESVTAILAWGEIGVNYVHQIETSNGQLSLGGTVKLLQGYEGSYVFNDIPIELSRLDGDSIQSSSGAIEFAYTSSLLDTEDYEFALNGTGIGLDLGAVYTIGGESAIDYKWKFGLSVLDIGRIKFTQNAARHAVSTDKPVSFGGPEYREFNRISETEDALRYFSSQVLGDSMASFQGNEFSVILPTAFSIQVDYKLKESIFINATILQGVPFGRNGLRRANLIGITPRIEKAWYGLSLPVSYYNFDQFRVGAALRLGPLFMGSSDLGSIFQRSDLSGTDFYVGIKIHPGLFGSSGGGSAGLNKSKSGIGPRCYKF